LGMSISVKLSGRAAHWKVLNRQPSMNVLSQIYLKIRKTGARIFFTAYCGRRRGFHIRRARRHIAAESFAGLFGAAHGSLLLACLLRRWL
jgi:hypothetical protein